MLSNLVKERTEIFTKKSFKYIGLVIFIIILTPAIPVFIDRFIFGNSIPSNISNEAWAGFLGSYLGGIATLVTVFITILNNDRKLENQKQAEKEAALEQRKLFIKPYLDTRYIFFNQKAETEENDRIAEIEGNSVKWVRNHFTEVHKHLIGIRQSDAQFIFLQYIIRNLGLGSAIDVNIVINDFPNKMTIAKDEKVSFYLMIDLQELKETTINIEIDYWDTDHKAHYIQKDCFVINRDGSHQTVKQREHIYPIDENVIE